MVGRLGLKEITTKYWEDEHDGMTFRIHDDDVETYVEILVPNFMGGRSQIVSRKDLKVILDTAARLVLITSAFPEPNKRVQGFEVYGSIAGDFGSIVVGVFSSHTDMVYLDVDGVVHKEFAIADLEHILAAVGKVRG